MKTFVLMWNPAISNVKEEQFARLIQNSVQEISWSVWDHEQVEEGDRFFLVKTDGKYSSSLVASGLFDGKVFKGEDWSGKGREVYYAGLFFEVIFHPWHEANLLTEHLQNAVPDFDWIGSHSGRLLTPEQAEALEVLWVKHLLEVGADYEPDKFGDISADNLSIMGTAYRSSCILVDYLRKTRGETCEVCGHNFQAMYGQDCDLHHDYILTKSIFEHCTLEDYHCLCSNCAEAYRSGIEVLRETH